MVEAVFDQFPPGESLAPGAVHVWRFFPESVEDSVLSRSESEQAGRFLSPEARAAFVAARCGVRRVGSLYTGIPPQEFLIEIDAKGKPYFANAEVHFNISHSGSFILAAFSDAPVGLDIEAEGRCRDYIAIARRFFRPTESEALAASRDERDFLRLWTGKEAMLKLSGDGLSGGLTEAVLGEAGVGLFRDRTVYHTAFLLENHVGTVAAFRDFEVKGWFHL